MASPRSRKAGGGCLFSRHPAANTQGIYLIVAPQFPPHAINELHHSSNSLPIDRDSVRTVIDLPYGHYDAISLWWYSKETKSNLADILALPLAKDSLAGFKPVGFDLSSSHASDYIKLYPDWNKVNRDASLEGTIYFNGPFPKNTLATAIAAYSYTPDSNLEYLTYMKQLISAHKTPIITTPIRSGAINFGGAVVA
jgi:hypothetical protein